MNEIVKTLTYGEETKTMRLYMPAGGGGSWYVSIDKFHYGQVIWQQDRWMAHVHESLETMDIALIEEMITEVMPKGPYE